MTGEPDPMAPIRARFIKRCRRDLALVQAALADPSLRTEEGFRTVVHGLSGAAGVFGHGQVSERAGLVDDALHDGRPVADEAVADLVEALQAIL